MIVRHFLAQSSYSICVSLECPRMAECEPKIALLSLRYMFLKSGPQLLVLLQKYLHLLHRKEGYLAVVN